MITLVGTAENDGRRAVLGRVARVLAAPLQWISKRGERGK